MFLNQWAISYIFIADLRSGSSTNCKCVLLGRGCISALRSSYLLNKTSVVFLRDWIMLQIFFVCQRSSLFIIEHIFCRFPVCMPPFAWQKNYIWDLFYYTVSLSVCKPPSGFLGFFLKNRILQGMMYCLLWGWSAWSSFDVCTAVCTEMVWIFNFWLCIWILKNPFTR